uniref:Uncharacterized protein n=1 Tax=Lympha mucosa TaxID=2045360 RepID=A0A6B9VPD6_9FLOR|nr:hypothetical protein [Lympha mucosa]
MIKYWPEKQGVNLDNEVVNLFRYAYSKLDTNLHNNTSCILSTDIINIRIKRELFKVVLYELEILVLDIIELNLTLEELKIVIKKITIDLIKKSMDNFYLLIQVQSINVSQFYHLERFCDSNLFLENFLIYLIFGSNTFASNNVLFLEINIPVKYIEVLLDNLVIQISNIVFLNCITNQLSLSSLLIFLISHNLCNDTYISIKSLATFRNNLVWQDLIDYYLIQPKIIYNNRCKVWLLTPEGLSCKYIYACRESDFFKLSNLQLMIILLLELQDFLFPKINNIIINLSKILIYTWGYCFNQFFKLLLKSIFCVFRAKK